MRLEGINLALFSVFKKTSKTTIHHAEDRARNLGGDEEKATIATTGNPCRRKILNGKKNCIEEQRAPLAVDDYFVALFFFLRIR